MRYDDGLAFMLRYENIAWFEEGKVRILDRRVYPREVKFVTCSTPEEVAQSIKDMVTQSAGPYTAAAMGMVLAAYRCRHEPEARQRAVLQEAAHVLSHPRPTTTSRMMAVTQGCLNAMENHYGPKGFESLFEYVMSTLENRYRKMDRVGWYLSELFPKKAKVMTQCYGETIIGMMIRHAQRKGKEIALFCPETRPFLQGARFTASVAYDMGCEVTVITDNMGALAMEREGIDLFTSAADAITMDGHVCNKVGTYGLAILARNFQIPYFVTGIPDIGHPDRASLEIEWRNPEESLSAHGIKHTKEGVRGYYPAFDITPPKYIDGVVTDQGIFSPYNLSAYLEGLEDGFYSFGV